MIILCEDHPGPQLGSFLQSTESYIGDSTNDTFNDGSILLGLVDGSTNNRKMNTKLFKY